MKILMVLTSHDRLGNTDQRTGFWLEEFAAPYYAFLDAGAEVALASPAGGQPPVDPNSAADEAGSEATRRFEQDEQAQAALARTRVLADMQVDDFDALFYPGGHGPLWDLTNDPHSIALIEAFERRGKPVALVCHAPGALRDVRGPDGEPLVRGKRVTGFTNSEEAGVQLTEVVPFLVEDMLRERGAEFRCAADWQSHVEVDGLLITGQNPASSAATAQALLDWLSKH